jgi:hypothetical protein
MNAKKLSFLLLILVAVACTNRSTSSEQDEMRHWNNVLQQINALLLENKARQTLDLAKQTLPEILESAEKNGTTDTLIYYARKIFNACGNNYKTPNNTKTASTIWTALGTIPSSANIARTNC